MSGLRRGVVPGKVPGASLSDKLRAMASFTLWIYLLDRRFDMFVEFISRGCMASSFNGWVDELDSTRVDWTEIDWLEIGPVFPGGVGDRLGKWDQGVENSVFVISLSTSIHLKPT